MQKFIDKIKKNFPNLPIIYYAQKIEHYKHLKNIDCFGFDSSHNIIEILQNHHNEFSIQGNFDQNILTMEAEISKTKMVEYMNEISQLNPEILKGWINGLGHGVVKESIEENVREFIKQNKVIFQK